MLDIITGIIFIFAFCLVTYRCDKICRYQLQSVHTFFCTVTIVGLVRNSVPTYGGFYHYTLLSRKLIVIGEFIICSKDIHRTIFTKVRHTVPTAALRNLRSIYRINIIPPCCVNSHLLILSIRTLDIKVITIPIVARVCGLTVLFDICGNVFTIDRHFHMTILNRIIQVMIPTIAIVETIIVETEIILPSIRMKTLLRRHRITHRTRTVEH